MVHIKETTIGFGYCVAFCGKEVDEMKASISPSNNTCSECLRAYNESQK